MNGNKVIRQEILTGERVLFQGKNLTIIDTVFMDGESPLKEAGNISLEGCMFEWKYPLWYCNNVLVKGTNWYETARAGVWYTNNISVEDALIEAPKNFRRCRNLKLEDVDLPNASETLWSCQAVTLNNVTARGDYFAMNCSDMKVNNLSLSGNYSFDGVKNVEVRDSKLLSRDAFWNSDNVTIYDSFISGEYLGWNSSNLRLVNCTIESLQGMCYIDNLILENCKLINTTLAFEYATVHAEINGQVESILNPKGGVIKADLIKSLIVQKDMVNPDNTKIVCDAVLSTPEKPFL